MVVNSNPFFKWNYHDCIVFDVGNPTFINTFPRLLHDIFASYGIIFWVWQVIDAYRLTKNRPS
jgi:hypothetical protein